MSHVVKTVCCAALTQEAGHPPSSFGHVHLQDEVSVGGEAKQRAFLSPKLHQLLQDGRVLLKTHTGTRFLQTLVWPFNGSFQFTAHSSDSGRARLLFVMPPCSQSTVLMSQ